MLGDAFELSATARRAAPPGRPARPKPAAPRLRGIRSPRSTKTPPGASSPPAAAASGGCGSAFPARSGDPAHRTIARSLRITRSTASCFIRQYSCACSNARAISRSSASAMRNSTIGRSPEIPKRPQARTARPAPRTDRFGRRSQAGIGVDHMARQALEQAGFARGDAEMMQLHLRLGPGERGGALEGGVRRDACR